MKTKIALLLLILSSIITFGQTNSFKAPDYDLISKSIIDKKSEFYYPELLTKLKTNDTLISKNQYEHLYFGYIFQKEYNPYKFPTKQEELSKYYQGQFNKDEIEKVIKVFKESLNEFPLDLRAMNFLAYLYHESGNEEMATKVSRNFHGLFSAIALSGDGLTCDTGFHVISVSHEYVLLNMFDLKNISQGYDGKCDFLQFEKDKYKIAGMYFNVSKLQEKNIQILKSKF